MIHQLYTCRPAGRTRPLTWLLLAALAIIAMPASARDCLDYSIYGGPHGDPPLVGGISFADDALDVAFQAGHAYLACGAGGLQVVELSVPSVPAWVGEEDLLGDAVTVAVWENLALVGVGSAIKVLDISRAPEPEWLQSLGTGGVVRDVVIEGSLALASAATAGLVVFDLTEPDLLGAVSTVTTSAAAWSAAVSADGATAWVATDAGVEIVALDGEVPELTGTLVTGRAMRRVVVDGDLLWAATVDGLLLACDVSDPRTPRELRRHTIASPVVDLRVDSGFAYLACADGLTRVAGVGGRGVMVPMGSLPVPGAARAVTGFGPYVLIAAGDGGLQLGWQQCDLILDAGPAANPRARLMGVVPNPINPSTTVIYSLAAPAHVRITLHDARGRTVADLVDERRPVGTQQVKWSGYLADGSRAPSGVWFVRMEAGGRVDTTALTLLR